MLAQQRQDITALFHAALAPILNGTDVVSDVVLERPRDPSHGDVACNIAMQLSKQLKINPRELAKKVVEALLANPEQGLGRFRRSRFHQPAHHRGRQAVCYQSRATARRRLR
jgi:arginyl-tRNA synthetase